MNIRGLGEETAEMACYPGGSPNISTSYRFSVIEEV